MFGCAIEVSRLEKQLLLLTLTFTSPSNMTSHCPGLTDRKVCRRHVKARRYLIRFYSFTNEHAKHPIFLDSSLTLMGLHFKQ